MKRLLLLLFVPFAIALGQGGWTAIDNETATSYFRGVDYLPNGTIWIAGCTAPYGAGNNYGFRSTDHGATWTRFDIATVTSVTSCAISNITARDANTALVGLTTGELLRTSNGGVKWDTVFSYAQGFFDGVKFITPDTVLAFGDADAEGMMVVRSIDAGKTWTRLTNLPDTAKGMAYGYVTYGQAMDTYGKTVWIALYSGSGTLPVMLKTTDAGETWEQYVLDLQGGASVNYYFRAIAFKDGNIGYGICRRVGDSSTWDNYLMKTTDGGKTWSDTISVEPGAAHPDAKPQCAKPIRGTSIVFASGYGLNGTKIWKSTDDGNTWSVVVASGPNTDADIRNMAFISATKGIGVGYQDLRLYSVATHVERFDPTLPDAYQLHQNYPNPFNPVTNISFSIAAASSVELTVYDVLGRRVATLVQGERQAGTHTVQFDATGLASGVYLYILRSGEFTATRSLVVLK